MLRQPPPHRSGLLGAQVQGQVFLVLVEEAELGALGGVDDGEDAGDGFAEVVAICCGRHGLVHPIPDCFM